MMIVIIIIKLTTTFTTYSNTTNKVFFANVGKFFVILLEIWQIKMCSQRIVNYFVLFTVGNYKTYVWMLIVTINN